MKEIVTVSVSQRAAHLLCHFYNQEESRLDYSGRSNGADTAVFLDTFHDTTHNTVSYKPRALVVDSENGFGSLSRYEYDDEIEGVQKLQLGDKIEKNEYQTLLDSSAPTAGILNNKIINYWSDYTRFLYDARSLNKVSGWYYNPESHALTLKSDPNLNLYDYDIGVTKYQSDHSIKDEIIDENFRTLLERCDNLQGLNMITEMDSSWSGLNREFLQDFRDEYLAKTSIITWALYDPVLSAELPMKRELSRYKATLLNCSESSLFIPLQNSTQEGSTWEITGLLAPVYESVNLVFKNTTMTDFVDGFTMGTSRNMVTDLTLKGKSRESDLIGEIFHGFQNSHTFSETCITRGKAAQGKTNGENEKTEAKRGLVNYSLGKFEPLDSLPHTIEDQFDVTLSCTDRLRPVYKRMNEVVKRGMRGDERDWYIEEIAKMLDEYEFGWSDDEEYD